MAYLYPGSIEYSRFDTLEEVEEFLIKYGVSKDCVNWVMYNLGFIDEDVFLTDEPPLY